VKPCFPISADILIGLQSGFPLFSVPRPGVLPTNVYARHLHEVYKIPAKTPFMAVSGSFLKKVLGF
jgi:hypothetical protein